MHKINNIKRNILRRRINISSLNFQNEMSIKGNKIDVNEKGITINELMPIEIKNKEFDLLMGMYKRASNQVLEMLNGVNCEYKNIFKKDIINHIISRIKAPKSILNKMKNKGLELNYKNLVNNINDIAGVRVICSDKEDIYAMVNIIKKVPNWNLIIEKDYIQNSKKSGYSGYHMIVEVPVRIEETDSKESHYLSNLIFVKVEIQIRTIAMDFWATHEHKIKYKTEKKLSFLDSKKLILYAKVINIIDNKFAKMSKKNNISEYI